ncbi:MAG: ABC transporter permease subunit, partial [Solirubrobacteraceae bacterium]
LTPLGVRVRAVAADRSLAEAVGVHATRLNLAVFAVGVALASLAGVLVAPISSISPTMGANYLFTAFVVVIVSGKRIAGIIAGAIGFGVVQDLVSLWWNPVTAQLAVLVLAFVALQWLRRASVAEAV